MSALSRRNFLKFTGSAAAGVMSQGLTNSADAAMGPADKFDLVIKGGDVLDPSQSLRGKRDIGIRWGVVEAIEPEIAPARALKTIDATGKLVTPGLIDRHSRRRAGTISGHHDCGLGRRRRRQQPCVTPPLYRGAIARTDLRVRAHR